MDEKSPIIDLSAIRKEQERVRALGADYAEKVALNWPLLEHAPDVILHLPLAIPHLLEEQNDDFLVGWYNAIAMVHDMGVKVLTSEIVKRTGGVASDERDILVTRVGAVIEGLGYFACKEATQRRSKADGKDKKGKGS